jgi:K+-transporting ATPase ATPase A chain
VELTGKEYATCFVLFGFAGTLLLYAILRVQQFLPWFFPQYHTTPLSPDLDLNAAISFSTTTTWQAYAGENTMSYFSQMVGLCAQNFLAGAAGLAVGVANNFAAQMTTHEHAERQEIHNTVTLI